MTSLLERERELTAVEACLADASAGRGRAVLIEGEPGIGKSSLLRAASGLAAEHGFVCLRARAREVERGFAYGCVRQLLEPTIAKASAQARADLFAGAAAMAEPVLAPPSPGTAQVADISFATLHGLYWLFDELAGDRPVAAFVDDLQWADPESLRFLQHLVPRLDGVALVVIAAARPVPMGAGHLAQLVAEPELEVLRLSALSSDGVTVLCRRTLGDELSEEFTTACGDATGGVPFLLETLLDEAAARGLTTTMSGAETIQALGPEAVARSILARLAEAPSLTDLVQAVAVLGGDTRLEDAARLAGMSVDAAAEAADRLVALHVFDAEERAEFTHPIVREAVYRDLPPHRRADLHRRAALVLAAAPAPDEQIAAHLLQADPEGDAGRVDLLRRVAVDALGRGAPATAVELLKRALDEPPPADELGTVLLELATAELRIAAPDVLDHLTRAVDVLSDELMLTTAVRLLGNAMTWASQSDRGVEALERAIGVVAPVDRESALVLEADLSAHAQEAGLDARQRVAGRIEHYVGLTGATPAERLALAALDFEKARASSSEREAAAHLTGAFGELRLLEEQELDVPPTLYVLVVGLLATDELDLADAVQDRMLADARAVVSVPAIAFVLAHQGVARMRRGDVPHAEADARMALDLLVSHGIPLGSELALSVIVDSLVERGELDEADALLAERGAGPIPASMPTNALLLARARLHGARGRTDAALADFVEFGRRDELWGGANPLASRWRSRAALVLAASGRGPAARDLARDDLDRAERWGAPSSLGLALHASALVADEGPSADGLRDAVAVLEGSVARLDLARALVDLGAELRRRNQRREARRFLTEGIEIADACGAQALARRARTELRAAGAAAPSPRRYGPESLTASERRVAELAAAGHSNPEIAQMLFVTRKTVETHLGSVYRKLDVSGRGKLAGVLGGVP